MFNFNIFNFIQKLNFDRVSILLNRLELFEKKSKNQKIIKSKNFESLKKDIVKKSKFIDRLIIYKLIIVLVVYFSFISSLISKIDYFGVITNLVSIILEVLGITFLIILLFIVNYLIDLKLYEINLIYTDILNLE